MQHIPLKQNPPRKLLTKITPSELLQSWSMASLKNTGVSASTPAGFLLLPCSRS
jgi:hypothetical protein